MLAYLPQHRRPEIRRRIGPPAAICLLVVLLAGCAAFVVGGVPVDFMTTEVLPRAVNGKGLVEDGTDLATGKDCRAVEGIVRKDRQVCETRGSPATQKDFKGLSGMLDDKTPGKVR